MTVFTFEAEGLTGGHVAANSDTNANTMPAREDNVCFETVGMNGGLLLGSLVLNNKEITFTEAAEERSNSEDDSETTSTTSTTNTNQLKPSSWVWRWPLDCIQENLIIKPVSCTVELTFVENPDTAPTSTSLPESEDSLSLRFTSTTEVMRFRKAMSKKLKKNRKAKNKASGKTSKKKGAKSSSSSVNTLTTAKSTADNSFNISSLGTMSQAAIQAPNRSTASTPSILPQPIIESKSFSPSRTNNRTQSSASGNPFQLPKENVFSSLNSASITTASSTTPTTTNNNNNLPSQKEESVDGTSSLKTTGFQKPDDNSLDMGAGSLFNPGVKSISPTTTKKRKVQKGDNEKKRKANGQQQQQQEQQQQQVPASNTHSNQFPTLASIPPFGLHSSQSQPMPGPVASARTMPVARATSAAAVSPTRGMINNGSMQPHHARRGMGPPSMPSMAGGGMNTSMQSQASEMPVLIPTSSMDCHMDSHSTGMSYSQLHHSDALSGSSYSNAMPNASAYASRSAPHMAYHNGPLAPAAYGGGGGGGYDGNMNGMNNHNYHGRNATWDQNPGAHYGGDGSASYGPPMSTQPQHLQHHVRGRSPGPDPHRHAQSSAGWDSPGNGAGGPAANSVRREFSSPTPYGRPMPQHQHSRSVSPMPSRLPDYDRRSEGAHMQRGRSLQGGANFHRMKPMYPSDLSTELMDREPSPSESSSYNMRRPKYGSDLSLASNGDRDYLRGKPRYPSASEISLASKTDECPPSPSESSSYHVMRRPKYGSDLSLASCKDPPIPETSNSPYTRRPKYGSDLSLASQSRERDSSPSESGSYVKKPKPRYTSDSSVASNRESAPSASSSYTRKPKHSSASDVSVASKTGPSPSSPSSSSVAAPTPAPALAPVTDRRRSMIRRVQSFRHPSEGKIRQIMSRENSSRSLDKETQSPTSEATITAPPSAMRRSSTSFNSTASISRPTPRISDPTSMTSRHASQLSRSMSPKRTSVSSATSSKRSGAGAPSRPSRALSPKPDGFRARASSPRRTAAENFRHSDTSTSSSRRTAADNFRNSEPSSRPRAMSPRRSSSALSDSNNTSGGRALSPKRTAAENFRLSDTSTLSSPRTAADNFRKSEPSSRPRTMSPRRSSSAVSKPSTQADTSTTAQPSAMPTSRLSAAKLAAFQNRKNVLSGSTSSNSPSPIISRGAMDNRKNLMRRTISERNVQRPPLATQESWDSAENGRNQGRSNGDSASNSKEFDLKNTTEDAASRPSNDKSRFRANAPTTSSGVVHGTNGKEDDSRTDQEELERTSGRKLLAHKKNPAQERPKGVLKLDESIGDEYDDDEDEAALRAVRKEFELEAKLKKEMASLGNTAALDRSDFTTDSDDDDSYEALRRELVSRSRDRLPAERVQSHTDRITGGGRRRLMRKSSSDRQLEKPPAFVKKQVARSKSAKGSLRSKAQGPVISVDRAAGHDGSTHRRTISQDDDDTRFQASGDDEDREQSDKKKNRRRLLRTTSSERELCKPPSLVKKEMSRLGSRRNLRSFEQDEDNEEIRGDDVRNTWRKTMEKRKMKLSSRSLANFEKAVESKPSQSPRRNLSRAHSARNMQPPSLPKQESFRSVRSGRSDGDEPETPDESVWAESAPPATKPGAQHVVGEPKGLTREVLKERQNSVRRDLVNLGNSSRSLQKAGSSRSLHSSTSRSIQKSLSNASLQSSNRSLLEDLGLLDGDTTVDSRTIDSQSPNDESLRPSDEKAAERPAMRATRPGAQQVDSPVISHTQAKQDMASLGTSPNVKTLAVHDVGHDPAFAKRASYGDEESKEEISDGNDGRDSVPGSAWARNEGPEAAMRDGIALKEMQMTSAVDGATPAQSDDGNEDRQVREKLKAFGGGDLETGVQEVTANLIEATLVDDAAEGIVSAVTVDPMAEKRRIRKVYATVTLGCGSLVLLIVLLTVFLTPKPEAIPEVPPLTPEERYELFYDYFDDNVYNTTLLEDPKTPQSQALQWISMVDTVYEDPTELDARQLEKMNQRYYLAVFYYTMVQERPWLYCRPPETGESNACVHTITESYGVEGVYYNQHEKEPTFRWLSNVDECKWGGVRCEDGRLASHLRLANTNMASTLPVEVAALRHLQVLDLQQNELKGTLPAAWGEMAKNGSMFASLRLDSNQFVGTIPESWCHMNRTSLKELILANNGLTGTLPSCLMELRAMEDFSVKDNMMTGTIPQELGDLLNLQTIHMAGNNFTEKMPGSLCWLQSRYLFEASADCLNILSDKYVQCTCCTKCCDGGEETCKLTEEYRT